LTLFIEPSNFKHDYPPFLFNMAAGILESFQDSSYLLLLSSSSSSSSRIAATFSALSILGHPYMLVKNSGFTFKSGSRSLNHWSQFEYMQRVGC
jgi:hypothetical protein